MKIISKRPGLEMNCRKCNSEILVESNDVQDKRISLECGTHPESISVQFWFWNCPICRHDNEVNRQTLPQEWPAYQPPPLYALSVPA